MKSLTIILLTANLALAAWQFWFSAPVPPALTRPLPAPPLVLAGELPASPPPARTTDAEAAESARELICQALGPYLDRDAAVRASRDLAAAGLNPEMREVDTSHRLGFWVFIPPAADRAEAGGHIERLREAGVRDYYLVADGDNANAVSLGVFSSRDAAGQHAARLRGLGFEVEIGERRRTIAAWWLDFIAPPPGSTAASLVARLVLEADDALVLDVQPCH